MLVHSVLVLVDLSLLGRSQFLGLLATERERLVPRVASDPAESVLGSRNRRQKKVIHIRDSPTMCNLGLMVSHFWNHGSFYGVTPARHCPNWLVVGGAFGPVLGLD